MSWPLLCPPSSSHLPVCLWHAPAAPCPQAFARLSAVYGGTYMLAKPDVEVGGRRWPCWAGAGTLAGLHAAMVAAAVAPALVLWLRHVMGFSNGHGSQCGGCQHCRHSCPHLAPLLVRPCCCTCSPRLWPSLLLLLLLLAGGV